jgi:threonine dehydrogenase-like Zn-dependent dehydrogenase
LSTAIQAVRKTGTIAALALWESKAEIDPNYIVLKQITYMGVIPYMPGDFQEVIEAIDAGRNIIKSSKHHLS